MGTPTNPKTKNTESITTQAIKNLPPNAKPEKLDEDWLVHLFDHCDKVSDTIMQLLWANLLAKEATNPNVYSKRTLNLVALMDKSDAKFFTKFCQFVWVIGDGVPLIFDYENEIYKEQGINFKALKHLDAIGLISFDPVGGYEKYGLYGGGNIFLSQAANIT